MKRPQFGAKKLAADRFARKTMPEAKQTRREFLDQLKIASAPQCRNEKVRLGADDVGEKVEREGPADYGCLRYDSAVVTFERTQSLEQRGAYAVRYSAVVVALLIFCCFLNCVLEQLSR